MRIERTLPVALWLGALAATAAGVAARGAEAPKRPSGPDPHKVSELVVEARGIERPLMKYRLYPPEYELRDGNAAPILLRLPWEQTPYFAKNVPAFAGYLDLPLDDPKLRDARDLFNPRFYEALKRAAYKRTANWEYPIGEDPLGLILIPDVQGARWIVGDGLSVWIRQHLARGQMVDAREAILVGLAVSRHYARTPFVITQLVAAHVDSALFSRLEELLAQPGCPNLYWALSALPRPLLDLRPSIELEQRFLQMSIPGGNRLDQARTVEQWTEMGEAALGLLSTMPNRETNDVILARLAKQARRAKPEWIEGGADRVGRMSDPEAALVWLLHLFDEQMQETAALMSLDPPRAIPRLAALEKRTHDFYVDLGAGQTVFVLERLPEAYLAVHAVERRIDALRVVEAIRDYAAGHGRQLPPSLDKIVDAPVPDDPLTGKPFRYEVKDGAATVSADGFPATGRVIGEVRYRVRIQK